MATKLEIQCAADRLPCGRCNGTGIYVSREITGDDGKIIIARKESACSWCDSVGYFVKPDIETLVKLIKGRKPGTLRSKRPDDSRAYFIWRMVRFHTGADVCLPMMAGLEISGDPYQEMLDAISEMIAQKMTGHKSAGRARWQSAMYGTDTQEKYMPESAFPGGRIIDGNKPESELLELF
jgi:hypothetical protein